MIFAGTFFVQWGLGVLTDLFEANGYQHAQALTYALICLAVLQWSSLFWFWVKKPQRG